MELIMLLENTKPSVIKLTRNFDFGATFRIQNPKPILLMIVMIQIMITY